MTVQSSGNRNDSVADGIQTVFPYNYLVLDASHMEVYLDGVLTPTGWTIDGIGNPLGGNVTFAVAPADQVEVTRLRVVPLTQEIDYTEYDAFPAETHEGGLDLGVMRDQQQQEELDRSLHYKVGDTPDDGAELPAPVPNKGLGYDADGNLANIPGPEQSTLVENPMVEHLKSGGFYYVITSDAEGNLPVGAILYDAINDRMTLYGTTDLVVVDKPMALVGAPLRLHAFNSTITPGQMLGNWLADSRTLEIKPGAHGGFDPTDNARLKLTTDVVAAVLLNGGGSPDQRMFMLAAVNGQTYLQPLKDDETELARFTRYLLNHDGGMRCIDFGGGGDQQFDQGYGTIGAARGLFVNNKAVNTYDLRGFMRGSAPSLVNDIIDQHRVQRSFVIHYDGSAWQGHLNATVAPSGGDYTIAIDTSPDENVWTERAEATLLDGDAALTLGWSPVAAADYLVAAGTFIRFRVKASSGIPPRGVEYMLVGHIGLPVPLA